MNRILRRESPIHGRNATVLGSSSLRQGKLKDESLDLFPRFQRSQSTGSHNKSMPQNGMLGKSGMDDIFTAEVGNTDYEWLLTPPGSPGDHHQLCSSAALKCNPKVRSVSATKPSRLSATRQENPNSTKPIRSNSVTRPSISSTNTSYTTKSTHLNTSSASVTSKPSPTPTKPAPRPSTPAKTRQTPTSTRPCTPSARPRTPSTTTTNSRSITPAATRSNSRPSTPTRRSPTPTTSSRRPSSPAPRTPERPVSTGKQRERIHPVLVSSSGNINGRGESRRNVAKTQVLNGVSAHEAQKAAASEVGARRSTRSASPIESNGFGRTISKKSLDVAVKHMDIRQGMGGIRGASIFPHSIRSSSNVAAAPIANKSTTTTTTTTTNGNRSPEWQASESGSTNGNTTVARVRELDREIYESTRYDLILLKEDSKNLSWLHSIDDVSVGSPLFHRFEPVPEPFGIL